MERLPDMKSFLGMLLVIKKHNEYNLVIVMVFIVIVIVIVFIVIVIVIFTPEHQQQSKRFLA